MTLTARATAIGSISIWLWGTLALFTRLTDGRIPPFQLMAMTFAIAWLLMFLRWRRQGHCGWHLLRQPAAVWLIGIGGYFGYHFCYFLAMSKAPAVQVSLLAYLWPLLIVLLSTLLPGQQLRLAHVAGALLALAGCWLLIGDNLTGFSADYLAGYLLALGCALIWSGFSVVSRLRASVTTDTVGWYCAGSAMLAAISHLCLETTVWPGSAAEWAGIIGLGLGPVGIAFITWDHGVKHGNLQLLGVLAYSAPLISVILLVLFGYAQPSWELAWACLAIVGGSLLAGIDWRRRLAVRSGRLAVTDSGAI